MAQAKKSPTEKLRGSNVLLFGGSSGIGFAVALAALDQGANVTMASSQQIKVDKAVSRLREANQGGTSSIDGHVCDLSKPQDLENNILKLFQATTSKGKVDHIVLTASDAVSIKPIFETSVADMQAAGIVRFLAALVIGKLAPDFMNSGPKSSITFTGGTMSHRPSPNWTVQAAWGSGIEGVMRGLAVDLAPVRVNAVSPGAVHTELFDTAPAETREGILQGWRDASLSGTVARPDEAAESYIYCMRSRFVTGTVAVVDGGRGIK